MKVGPLKRPSAEELILSNCGVLKKTLESPLDSKEIQPVHPKENQPWIFVVRTDAEAPILWLPDVKSRLIGKDPDTGKDWRQRRRGQQDEMVGWHHWLNGHEFDQTLGDRGGQRSLMCCSPCGLKNQTWLSDWKTTANLESILEILFSRQKLTLDVNFLSQHFWYLIQQIFWMSTLLLSIENSSHNTGVQKWT